MCSPTSTHSSRKCDHFVIDGTESGQQDFQFKPAWDARFPPEPPLIRDCRHTFASPSAFRWPDKQICNCRKCFLAFCCTRHKEKQVLFIIDRLLTTAHSPWKYKRHQSFSEWVKCSFAYWRANHSAAPAGNTVRMKKQQFLDFLILNWSFGILSVNVLIVYYFSL